MQTTPKWLKGLAVTVAGHGVVSHVGTAGLRGLAFKTGLAGALSSALRVPHRTVIHDRGQVLSDLAVVIADGGRAIGHIRTLRDQGELFGPVASASTCWRALDEIDDRRRARIETVRARVRRRVWDLIVARHGRIPPSATCYGDLGGWIVIRLDATIQIAHSDKERAAGTFKGTYGHHLLTAWCDNTGESLAIKLRAGNAGANTTDDHIEVLSAALGQIPGRYRRRILVTTDGAGATIDLHTFDQPPVTFTEERVRLGRCGCDLAEQALEVAVALPALARPGLRAGLDRRRVEFRPRHQMRGRLEPGHVQADLRDDDLCAASSDSGDLIQPVQHRKPHIVPLARTRSRTVFFVGAAWAVHGGDDFVDPAGEPVDLRGEHVDLVEDHLRQLSMVVVEPSVQSGDECGALAAHPAPGHVGQHSRVPLSRDHRLDHLPTRHPEDVRRHDRQFDQRVFQEFLQRCLCRERSSVRSNRNRE